jgi:hypothetical protein
MPICDPSQMIADWRLLTVLVAFSFTPGFSPVLRVIIYSGNRLNGFFLSLLENHRAKARCE